MLKTIIRTVVVLCALSSNSSYTQSSQSSAPQIWGDPGGFAGRDCETSMMLLDFVAIADRDAAVKDQVIIVITRPGIGESSRTLMRARLKQVADYLNRRVDRERIVTAEGGRIRGLGQLEFYVGGKLHTVIKLKRNRDLVRGCAEGLCTKSRLTTAWPSGVRRRLCPAVSDL